MRYVLSLILALTSPVSADTIRVSVAISLKDAVAEVATAYGADGGDTVVLTFGSSGQLATQIRNGAEVDAFVSAAEKEVADLARAGLVDMATRQVVARNRLVLVVPRDATDPPASFAALAGASVRKLAIGDPKTVPAGSYAMQVLDTLKISDQLTGRLVYGTNVRQVLFYVENGEVSAGIVYATDAREAGDKVKVIATAASETHEAIVYPAVAIGASRNAERAARFLAYLRADKAQRIFTERGFLSAPPTPATAPAPVPGK